MSPLYAMNLMTKGVMVKGSHAIWVVAYFARYEVVVTQAGHRKWKRAGLGPKIAQIQKSEQVSSAQFDGVALAWCQKNHYPYYRQRRGGLQHRLVSDSDLMEAQFYAALRGNDATRHG